MTTLQMLSLFIMPVGGLIIGFVALYITRQKPEDKHRPHHTH
jgi:hypothetical protein